MCDGIYCSDCKFANWDFSLFGEISKRSEFSQVQYFTEQFDIYCQKDNKFFLESESKLCLVGEYGQNNYHEICKNYYATIAKYNSLLRNFRAVRETSKDYIDIESETEFNKWKEYLKEHSVTLYNKFLSIMTRRKELIDLTGQVLNGMMSADSSVLSKLLDRTIHKQAAEIAVSIAQDALNKIDELENKKNTSL